MAAPAIYLWAAAVEWQRRMLPKESADILAFDVAVARRRWQGFCCAVGSSMREAPRLPCRLAAGEY